MKTVCVENKRGETLSVLYNQTSAPKSNFHLSSCYNWLFMAVVMDVLCRFVCISNSCLCSSSYVLLRP